MAGWVWNASPNASPLASHEPRQFWRTARWSSQAARVVRVGVRQWDQAMWPFDRIWAPLVASSAAASSPTSRPPRSRASR